MADFEHRIKRKTASAREIACRCCRAGEDGLAVCATRNFAQERLKRAPDRPANSLRSNSAGPMSYAAFKPLYGSLLTWRRPQAHLRLIWFYLRLPCALVLFICLSLLFPSAQAAAFDRETPVVSAVRKVGPAVVNISSEYNVAKRRQPFGMDPFFDNFFRDFFDARPQKRTSLGSGVIIDGSRGYILTNAHVIEKGSLIKVLLQDEKEFQARIVGVDADSDLAVLQVDSKAPLPSVDMGNSHDLMIGETVIAIGNPFGFSNTVTTGVISALNRSLKTEERVFHRFIQTDASINPGNSGGPLLNINGELIGINTAIYAKAQGIGFAIPIDRAKNIINDLIRFGHVIQAWVGLKVQDLDARMAQYLELEDRSGVVVSKVDEHSPATAAGLEPGDLVMSLDSTRLQSRDDYNAAVRAISAGDTVKVSIWRRGRQLTIPVKTAAYPRSRAPELAWERFGIRVRPTATAGAGVRIAALREDCYLADIGVAPGDVILEIDGQKMSGEADFTEAVLNSRLKSAVALLLKRQDQLYNLTVPLE